MPQPKNQKNKGGRPSRSGAPAKPQLRDPRTGRKYKDTPTNRMKLGLPMVGGISGGPSMPQSAQRPSVAPQSVEKPIVAPESQGGGHSAGAAAVSASLGTESKPDSAPTASEASGLPQVSYVQLIKIANMILKSKVPEAAMIPDEELQIGTALDAVIAKHFPAMKDFGVEFALGLAITAYVTRAILPLLMAPEVVEVPDAPELGPKPDAPSESTGTFSLSQT